MNSPRVFVSYSHEEPEHDQWVLELAAALRKNGVDASVDKWDLVPGQDTTFFMESQIRDSDFVVLVCTPAYAQKSNVPRGGVGYEKNIISAEMLQANDLRPKFIPLLRKGDFETALPTYLGSKYAIDFRPTRKLEEALDELLRAIYRVPHPTKPPLGKSPFAEVPVEALPQVDQVKPPKGVVTVGGNIDTWEKQALGRFEYLHEKKISKSKADPFNKGYWQASFILQGQLREVGLTELLELLRASETGRTGWDIGWVPTREGIAPYPFQDGIEVWLAEDGGKGPGHSDFWRAEPVGRFSLFRGYQEDEEGFSSQFPHIGLDFSLVLWRVSEFLLYIESFTKHLGIPRTRAMLKIRWTGLENRKLGFHKAIAPPLNGHVCHQATVESRISIPDTNAIKNTLITDVQGITRPLFEAFDFFAVSEDQVEQLLKGLFDPKKELGI